MGDEVKIRVSRRALESRLRSAFSAVKKNRRLQRDIGKFTVNRIRGFGRKGEPLNGARSFPILKPDTVRNRRRLRRYNQTGKPFRPDFSNLTLTGQFWKALTYEFDALKGKLFVFWKDSKRRPYVINKDGGTAKKTPTNQELFGYLRELGFNPFQAMDAKGIKTITRKIRSELRRSFRF